MVFDYSCLSFVNKMYFIAPVSSLCDNAVRFYKLGLPQSFFCDVLITHLKWHVIQKTYYGYIFRFCKAIIHKVSEFRAQVHRDGRKRILFALIILQKHNVSLLLWVPTNKRTVFTDWKDVLLLSVPKLQSILRASERTGASICPAVNYSSAPHSTQTLEQCTFL